MGRRKYNTGRAAGRPTALPSIAPACPPRIGGRRRCPHPDPARCSLAGPLCRPQALVRPLPARSLAPPPCNPRAPAAEGLPLRAVTDFEVAAAGGGAADGALRPLEALGPATIGQLVLTGQLVPAEEGLGASAAGGSGGAARHPLAAEPLLDWVVDHGASEPGIWAVTQHAWYRLLQPSARYAPLFASAQFKAAVARAAGAAAGAAADPEGVVERAAAALQAGGDQAAKEFALTQLQASGHGCMAGAQPAAGSRRQQAGRGCMRAPAGHLHRHPLPTNMLPLAACALQAKFGLRPRPPGKRGAGDVGHGRASKKQRVGGAMHGVYCLSCCSPRASNTHQPRPTAVHDVLQGGGGGGRGVRFAGGAGSAAASVSDFAALAGGAYAYGELEPESDGDVPDDFHPSGACLWPRCCGGASSRAWGAGQLPWVCVHSSGRRR